MRIDGHYLTPYSSIFLVKNGSTCFCKSRNVKACFYLKIFFSCPIYEHKKSIKVHLKCWELTMDSITNWPVNGNSRRRIEASDGFLLKLIFGNLRIEVSLSWMNGLWWLFLYLIHGFWFFQHGWKTS